MNRYDLCPVRPPEVRAAIANARIARPAAAVPPSGQIAVTVPTMRHFPVTVYGINESTPGTRWQALFDATWPGYRAWYLSHGDAARPDLPTATRMLASHMPELMPTYERLVELAGEDEIAARMLTLWDTPAFAPACSQAVLAGPEPALCRNYDYGVDLWERTIYTSAFTGRRVIGSGDCLWGLLDGMNEAGLAVSLAFGGRPGSGRGFAIPMVLRYLLEVATTVAQAREVLRDLPISMSYNLTMVDAAGESGTAFVGPDMPAEFSAAPVATNHRGDTPEYSERAARLRSVPRRNQLTAVLATGPGPADLAAAFSTDPLYNRDYSGSFGTLYTALYRPARGVVEFVWPGQSWRRGFDDADGTRHVVLVGQ